MILYCFELINIYVYLLYANTFMNLSEILPVDKTDLIMISYTVIVLIEDTTVFWKLSFCFVKNNYVPLCHLNLIFPLSIKLNRKVEICIL